MGASVLLDLLVDQKDYTKMSHTVRENYGRQVNKVDDRRKAFCEEVAVKEAMQSFDEQFNAIFKTSNQSAIQSAKSSK